MHNFNFNWLILAVCNKSSGMKIRSCFACNQLIENPLQLKTPANLCWRQTSFLFPHPDQGFSQDLYIPKMLF